MKSSWLALSYILVKIWQAKAMVHGAHPPHAAKPLNLYIGVPYVPLFPSSTSLVPKGIETKEKTEVPESATFAGI
jgi:hypothetical protein